MSCVGHQSPGLWAHPRDNAWRYRQLDYWTDLAKLLERGRFDGLFIADVLGTYDVYQGSAEAAIREAAQVPVNDPILLVSAMAHVTEHLGFGATCSLSYEHPYPFARRMSTLDHLTNGRIGWNIVTSYLDSAACARSHRTTRSSTRSASSAHGRSIARSRRMFGRSVTAISRRPWRLAHRVLQDIVDHADVEAVQAFGDAVKQCPWRRSHFARSLRFGRCLQWPAGR